MSEQPDNNQKFDYIKDISSALDFAKSKGEKGWEFLESTLAVLEILDSVNSGPIDLEA